VAQPSFLRTEMTSLKISGWKEGLNKVALTHLLCDEAGLGLKDAHESVCRLVKGEEVVVQVENATLFIEQARSIGVTTFYSHHAKGSRHESRR